MRERGGCGFDLPQAMVVERVVSVDGFVEGARVPQQSAQVGSAHSSAKSEWRRDRHERIAAGWKHDKALRLTEAQRRSTAQHSTAQHRSTRLWMMREKAKRGLFRPVRLVLG